MNLLNILCTKILHHSLPMTNMYLALEDMCKFLIHTCRNLIQHKLKTYCLMLMLNSWFTISRIVIKLYMREICFFASDYLTFFSLFYFNLKILYSGHCSVAEWLTVRFSIVWRCFKPRIKKIKFEIRNWFKICIPMPKSYLY